MSLKDRIERLEEAWACMGFRDFPTPSPDTWAEQMWRRARAAREEEEREATAEAPRPPSSGEKAAGTGGD